MRALSCLAVVTLLSVATPPIATAPAWAQTPPGPGDLKAYAGLHAAAARGDAAEIARRVAAGDPLDARDSNGRTPLHVAAFQAKPEVLTALLKAGADANALDAQKYDAITIASVRNDVPLLRLLIAHGGRAQNITSPYDGTALIAAAHLGHAEVVRVLIAAGAPLDHVNNLGWTALIESIVLGDGGRHHTDTLEALVKAGARLDLADRNGATPLTLAKARGYGEMVRILEAAGAK